MNPWHDVPIGKEAPKIINMIVEIPKDSKVKYELDKETGLLKLDRYLLSSFHYGGDYGFIPKTYEDDDDPLDIFVISSIPSVPLALCEVRVLGVIKVIDSKNEDNKIIAVHVNDMHYSDWNSTNDIPSRFMKEIEQFFATYKIMENVEVKIKKVLGKEQAYKVISDSFKKYQDKFWNK